MLHIFLILKNLNLQKIIIKNIKSRGGHDKKKKSFYKHNLSFSFLLSVYTIVHNRGYICMYNKVGMS